MRGPVPPRVTDNVAECIHSDRKNKAVLVSDPEYYIPGRMDPHLCLKGGGMFV